MITIIILGWSPWVIDVRLQTEHDIVALPFTDKVSPHRTVAIDDLPIDGDILVYCKAGVRGKKACKRLIDLGVDSRRLFNLDGGIMKVSILQNHPIMMYTMHFRSFPISRHIDMYD